MLVLFEILLNTDSIHTDSVYINSIVFFKKCYLATRHIGTWAERRYSFYSFLTLALDKGEWSASTVFNSAYWRLCKSDVHWLCHVNHLLDFLNWLVHYQITCKCLVQSKFVTILVVSKLFVKISEGLRFFWILFNSETIYI